MEAQDMIKKAAIWPLVVLLMTGIAFGQKVGYVDSKKVFAQYRGADDIRQEMNRMVEGWKKEVEKKRQIIDSLQKALDEQDLAISSERRKAKSEEVLQKKKELDAFVKEIFDAGGKAEQTSKELSKPMTEKIGSIIKKVALDNNLLMILDSSSGFVVYSSKDLDITDQVLEELAKEEGTAAKVIPPVAIFPVWDSDQESIRKKYGKLVQEYLFAYWDKGQQLKPVAKKLVEDMVKDKGLSKSEIKEAKGLEMAKILSSRYMTLGRVSQKQVSGQITVTLSLYDVESNQLLAEEVETASGETDLMQACENVAQRLGQKVLQ